MELTATAPLPVKTVSLVAVAHLLGFAVVIWLGIANPVPLPSMTMTAELIERESTTIAPTPSPAKPSPNPSPKLREKVTPQPQITPVAPSAPHRPPLPASQDATIKVEVNRTANAAAASPNATLRTIPTEGGAAPSAAAVVLPNSDARELNNPKPPYPSISRRLGEQGKVLLKACINAAGGLDSVALMQSSGFDRLDQIALETVQKWKFIPAKRGTQAVAMCYQLPVKFTLE